MRTQASSRAGATVSTVAVDLGATSVRVVEVEFAAGAESPRVTRRGAAPLPPGLWNDLAAGRDALSAAIAQALSGAGITARTVAACLPRRLVTLRFVRLPHAPPEQLRGMVEFEAQQYILFPLDDVILDYFVLSRPLDGTGSLDDMDTVLLAAARRSLIADIMAAFDRAGLDLRQLSVSALALAENARDSLEPTALIDVEPGEMDVAVVSDGQVLFTRASSLDIAGVRPEVAERREVEEVARSFTAYQNEYRNRPLTRIFVAGENATGAGGESLERALTELLEMPVSALATRALPSGDADARAWATAYGTALQTRGESIAPINLVPNERAVRRAQAAKGRRQQGIALVGAAAALGLVWYGIGAYSQSKKVAALTLTENNSLQANQDRLKKLKATHDKAQAVSQEITKGLDRNHPAVDVLYALNSALPASADIWLTQFQFERNGMLTIHGETKKAIAAPQLVLALQKSGAFTDVRLTYLGDSQDNTSGNSQTPAAVPAPAPNTASGASAAPAVPQLPGPSAAPAASTANPAPVSGGGAFGGNAGGAGPGRFGRGGFGGGFGGPGGPAGAAPTNGGQPFPSPAPSAPSPASGPAPGATRGTTFTPGVPGGAPQFIPIPAPAPSGKRAAPEESDRQAARTENAGEKGGRLILAGWQQDAPTAPAFPQDGTGGGGNGGNRPNRRNRQRNNNPGGGTFVPNGTFGTPAPGAVPGSVPAPTPAPTYSNGSIFGGGTPAGGGGPTPAPGTGGFDPNRPWRRRQFSGGPVSPFSPPPGGLQTTPRPRIAPVVRRPAVRSTLTNTPKQTLTSFVITCKVNARRANLIPANAPSPSATPAHENAASRPSHSAVRAGGANQNPDENGGDDADSQ